MAKAVIDIEVNGEEKLKDIQKDIDGISTKSVALGNIGADAIQSFAKSLAEAVAAGADFNRSLEEVNGTITKTSELEQNATSAFSAFAGAILEQTGLWTVYREAVDTTSKSFEMLTEAIGGTTAAQLEHAETAKKIRADRAKEEEEDRKSWEKHDKWAEEQTKAFEEREARKTKAVVGRIKEIELKEGRAIEAERARIKEKIDITREMINIYEEQGRSTDALIASLEQLEEIDVNHVDTIREKAEAQAITNQMTDDARKSTQDYTEAVYENTYALKKNMEETMPQGMGGAELPSGNYSKNELDRMRDPNGAYQKNRQSSYLKDIARSSRDTNDAVRGY